MVTPTKTVAEPDPRPDQTAGASKLRACVAAAGAALQGMDREPPGRRLVDGPTAASKMNCSYRTWLRLADAGKAPFGTKLGTLRRWDLGELDAWIQEGCKPVRRVGGAR